MTRWHSTRNTRRISFSLLSFFSFFFTFFLFLALTNQFHGARGTKFSRDLSCNKLLLEDIGLPTSWCMERVSQSSHSLVFARWRIIESFAIIHSCGYPNLADCTQLSTSSPILDIVSNAWYFYWRYSISIFCSFLLFIPDDFEIRKNIKKMKEWKIRRIKLINRRIKLISEYERFIYLLV